MHHFGTYQRRKKMPNITQKTLQNLHRKWNKDEYFKGCWTEFAVFSLYTPPQLPTDLRGEHRDIPAVVCVGRAERNVLFKQKPHRQHKTELYFAAVLLFVSFDWAVPAFGGSSKDSSLKTLAQPGGQAPPGVTTAPSLNTSKYGGETQQPHPKTTSCLWEKPSEGRGLAGYQKQKA